MTASGDLPIATTAEDVRRWLVAFFTDLPNAPVYAASRGRAVFVDPDKSPSGLDWPRFTADVLGARSRDRLWVLTWARCEARRRAIARNLPNPPAGGTVSDFCRESAVHQTTFYRVVDRSLTILAREWDRRRPSRERPHPEPPDPPQADAPELHLGLITDQSTSDPKARNPLKFSAPH